MRPQVVVGSYVHVLSLASPQQDDQSPFVSGVVAAIGKAESAGVPAIVTIHLGWNLADGSPATLYAPITSVVRDDARGEENRKKVSFANAPSGPVAASEENASAAAQPLLRAASESDASPEPAPEVVEQTVQQTAAASSEPVKSRILPSAGGTLSRTEFVDTSVEDDDGDWVTPDNIGSHIGHNGFSKSFETVRKASSVAECLLHSLCVATWSSDCVPVM